LFEARTLLEDLAVIARLKRLGVRGDSIFDREDAETSNEEIEEMTSGGALRLCALDSRENLDDGSAKMEVSDHLHDLEQVRTSIELLLSQDATMNATERGALLGRLARLIPDVADGLDAVKAFEILNAISAEDINEIVLKHRALLAVYGALASVIEREAEALGARHKTLPLLLTTLVAIEGVIGQQVLFGPKPLHGEKAYSEWLESVRAGSMQVERARLLLSKLSEAPVWAAG
jgi:hypothetical protein